MNDRLHQRYPAIRTGEESKEPSETQTLTDFLSWIGSEYPLTLDLFSGGRRRRWGWTYDPVTGLGYPPGRAEEIPESERKKLYETVGPNRGDVKARGAKYRDNLR